MHDAYISLAANTEKNGEPVNVAAVSKEENGEMMFRYHISKYPTIRLFKGSPDNFVEFDQADDGHDLTEKDFR